MIQSEDELFPRATGFLVVNSIDDGHPLHHGYCLLPGDLLQHDGGNRYSKVFPGLAISGFELSPEQVAELKAVEYRIYGLSYKIYGD